MQTHHLPFNHQEINQLLQLLAEISPHTKPMTLTHCHGLLTALVTSPYRITPNQWCTLLFSTKLSSLSSQQNQMLMQLFEKLQNHVRREIEIIALEPCIVNEDKIIPYQQASLEQIGQWCEGYFIGSEFNLYWQADKEISQLLIPFALITLACAPEFKQHSLELKQLLTDDPDWRNHLLELVYINYDYWSDGGVTFLPLPHHKPQETLFKVSRNDPCPCGSGRKYKKCCYQTTAQSIH